jgi:hypothetical protein
VEKTCRHCFCGPKSFQHCSWALFVIFRHLNVYLDYCQYFYIVLHCFTL